MQTLPGYLSDLRVVPLQVVMFEIQFLVLNYCPSFVSEFCLPSIALIACFKVVFTVALFSYMIRLFS